GDVQYNPQAFSPDGKYLYYTTDEGSEFSWLARYDLATGRRDTVERPSWDVDFAYFSKRGTYLVVGINADARTEIRLYEAATHRRVTLPSVPVGEIRGVQISPSERSMALYVNGSRAPSNLYVLDLGTGRGRLRPLTQNLSPDLDPASLVELVSAKRYLATLGYVDTSRVAVVGGSYGGYLTLAAVTFRPEVFAAGVDLFGISNWVRTLRSIPAWWESFRKALYSEMGDPNGADSVRLYRISPLFHADQIRKPLLVLQGANDPRVLKVESDQIVEAVRHRGGVAEYV